MQSVSVRYLLLQRLGTYGGGGSASYDTCTILEHHRQFCRQSQLRQQTTVGKSYPPPPPAAYFDRSCLVYALFRDLLPFLLLMTQLQRPGGRVLHVCRSHVRRGHRWSRGACRDRWLQRRTGNLHGRLLGCYRRRGVGSGALSPHCGKTPATISPPPGRGLG